MVLLYFVFDPTCNFLCISSCSFALVPTNYFLMVKCYDCMNEFSDFLLFFQTNREALNWNCGTMPTDYYIDDFIYVFYFSCFLFLKISTFFFSRSRTVILSFSQVDRRHYFRLSSNKWKKCHIYLRSNARNKVA